MKYTIELNKRQVETIMAAMEIYARLGIGQWRDAVDALPLKPDYDTWHDDLDAIGAILARHTKRSVNGWQSSLGISSADVAENAQIAWDVYQVIRKKLSWQRAVLEGVVESENSPRNWGKMMSVVYDDLFQVSNEPPVIIKSAEGKAG